MATEYLCPVCKGNRSEFEVIYKMAQEVRKDEATGDVVFQSDTLVTLLRDDGRPDLDIHCLKCGYTGSEGSFAKAARREEKAALRAGPRR